MKYLMILELFYNNWNNNFFSKTEKFRCNVDSFESRMSIVQKYMYAFKCKKKKNYHDPRSQHFSNAKYFREKIQTRSGSASESSSHGRYLSMRVHSTPFSLTYLFSRTKNNAFKCKNNLPLYARSFTIPYLRRYVARVEYKIHAESRTFFFL